MSENRVIGRDGGLPWKLPDEMQQFRALTLGHVVIMGRKSYEAEGKPLPHRRNLVLTRDRSWSPPPLENPSQSLPQTIEILHTLDDALDRAFDSNDPEPFIIGGADIYALALPRVDRMYLTTVHATLDGDTFFPPFDADGWQLTDQRHHPADARHAHAFTLNTYDRPPPPEAPGSPGSPRKA